MFLGQFYHNLDEKGRLTIPAKFRELLSTEGGYVIQGFDQNLLVLPSSTYITWSHHVNRMSLTDPTPRLLRRLFYSTAHQLDLDSSGRLLLPQFLRKAAGIDSEVVFVGSGDYFEIWSSEQWSHQAELLQDAQENAHRFSVFNLTSE